MLGAEEEELVHTHVDAIGLEGLDNLVDEGENYLVDAGVGDVPLAAVDAVVVGEGPDERAIRELAARLGVAERVRMLGRVAHDKLHEIYSAADVSILASEREGWPNVLLESLACGTPVVATDVGGVSEIVTSREAGVIVRQRTPEALATAVRGLFANLPDRDATRAYAEQFSWDATTRGQLELFGRILSDEPGYSKGP